MGLRELLSGAKTRSAVLPIHREIGRPPTALTETPRLADIIRRLLAAVAAGDDDETRRLLREHGSTLRTRAAEWMPPPAALAGNQAALLWRQAGVERLIWRCADQFGQAAWLGEWERLKGNNR